MAKSSCPLTKSTMGKKLGSKNVPPEQCNAVCNAVTIGVKVVDVTKYRNVPRSTVSNV